PKEILYVACHPAAWARDVGELVGGGYRLAFARPYDFFPFTHHVEVLSLLQLG
ncbi:MAG: RNA methyltransferase, partial [Thermus sp.]